MSTSQAVSCGLDFATIPDLTTCILSTQEAHFDFICAPMVHPLFKQEFLSGPAKNRPGPFGRPDMILNTNDWNNLVVGKISPHINVDSEIAHVRENSEAALHQELSFACHLQLPAVTFKLTGNTENHVNLARIINDKVVTLSGLKFWVQVPMENPKKQAMSYRHDDEVVCESPWEWWNGFRSLCDFHKKLGVALIVSHDTPDDIEVDRWLGEPITAIVIPTTIFLTNKRGYPVLSRAHQSLIQRFCTLNVQFILTGANRYHSVGLYRVYLDHIWKKGFLSKGPLQRYGKGYEDYLQVPLQPLMDNLDSGTYEVFEKDPVKYSKYQEAILAALVRKSKLNDDEGAKERKIVVTVVGAGRGPLVRAALNAADIARIPVTVYAVEKNPNAILTLHALNNDVFHNRVTIVSCDMREWKAPEKADILVSELLGSFGDNELSPECLDGAQEFLKDDGVSIPQSYTSYIGPVQSPKLYNEFDSCQDRDKHNLSHVERPYVCYLHNKYNIAKHQPLFTFTHPNRDEVIDNSRYEKRRFHVEQNAVMNGFVGYFDVILYENVTLSIVPETHSPGMLSWFPIVFPIKEPVQVKAGDKIDLHFWRRCDTKNVWYEWCLSSPIVMGIHNPNGRSHTIGK